MKVLKFLGTPFCIERLRWLRLKEICEGTSLVKILQSCHFNIFGINQRCFRKMPIKKNNEKPRLLKRLSILLFTYKVTCATFCSGIAKSYYVPIFLKLSEGVAKIIHNKSFKDNDDSIKM